jgi:o-succinylbenzoate synthase
MTELREIAWLKWQLPLKRKLTSKDSNLVREGILIRFRDSRGNISYGEAAPMIGLHQERLEEIAPLLINFIRSASEQLQGISFSQIKALELLQNLKMISGFSDLAASLRFAFESASLNMAANRCNTTLSKYLWDENCQKIPVNALFDSSLSLAESALKQGAFNGYKAVKIKVGRRPLSEEIATVKLFRKYLGHAVELRLDANCGFDLPTALSLAEDLQDYDVSYIEEPLENTALLTNFTDQSSIPVALDESLVADINEGHDPQYGKGIAAWILKPSLLGISKVLELIEASRFKNSCVISSSFESDIGTRVLAALAAGTRDIHGSQVAAGLATAEWFKADVSVKPCQLSDGFLHIESKAAELNAIWCHENRWTKMFLD